MTVRKAVIAVAGYGTRFLPATKVLPKELLPILDKPVIQYLVEEAVRSGIQDVMLVTRPGSKLIAEHFGPSPAIEAYLHQTGKEELCEQIRAIPQLANFAFAEQGDDLPYGNGSPVLAAKSFLGSEPFVYMFGDDMVLSESPCAGQILKTFDRHQPEGVIAVQDVPRDEISRYGSVKLKAGSDPPELEMIVEKPAPDKAPSTLAQFGRFVFSPKIVDILENLDVGKDNELWLTDAVAELSRRHKVLVQPIEGQWLTTGDPLRFLQTTVEYALRDPAIGEAFAEYLRGKT